MSGPEPVMPSLVVLKFTDAKEHTITPEEYELFINKHTNSMICSLMHTKHSDEPLDIKCDSRTFEYIIKAYKTHYLQVLLDIWKDTKTIDDNKFRYAEVKRVHELMQGYFGITPIPKRVSHKAILQRISGKDSPLKDIIPTFFANNRIYVYGKAAHDAILGLPISPNIEIFIDKSELHDLIDVEIGDYKSIFMYYDRHDEWHRVDDYDVNTFSELKIVAEHRSEILKAGHMIIVNEYETNEKKGYPVKKYIFDAKNKTIIDDIKGYTYNVHLNEISGRAPEVPCLFDYSFCRDMLDIEKICYSTNVGYLSHYLPEIINRQCAINVNEFSVLINKMEKYMDNCRFQFTH